MMNKNNISLIVACFSLLFLGSWLAGGGFLRPSHGHRTRAEW
jgi:hypothetical protein